MIKGLRRSIVYLKTGNVLKPKNEKVLKPV